MNPNGIPGMKIGDAQPHINSGVCPGMIPEPLELREPGIIPGLSHPNVQGMMPGPQPLNPQMMPGMPNQQGNLGMGHGMGGK